MELGLLFLTAVIVNSGIPFAQPKSQMGTEAFANEVSGDNKIEHNNLRNLLDSLSKNDMKKTDTLRNVLEQEAEREQTAFDTIKEDLLLARWRNVHKQRTLRRNGDNNGKKAAVFKRETHGNPGTCEAPAAEKPKTDVNGSTPLEPEKIDEFHDYKPKILYDFKEVVKAYEKKDIKFLRYFSTVVHELAGWGRVKVINNFLLEKAHIKYQNPMYFPTETKFLQYVTEQPQTIGNETLDHFYLTDGLKEDCVFYLKPTDDQLTLFSLGHHVCGVHMALRRNETRDFPPGGFAEPVEG